MKSWFVFVCTSLVIMGCAQAPVNPVAFTGPLAHINDASKKVSMVRTHFFELAMVDDQAVYSSSACTYDGGDGEQAGLNLCSARSPVPAGKRILHIRAVNYVTVPFFSLFTNMYKAEGDVVLTLEAGKEYFVKGEIFDDRASVWIEDARGDVVSRKIDK